jgi:redox-sensitive bicupin YhaK (pirin superfamily)
MIRYQDNKHQLINEDRVASSSGFGTHSHREFEIFSYVVAGELEQFVYISPPIL